jgi:hypothetical protein
MLMIFQLVFINLSSLDENGNFNGFIPRIAGLALIVSSFFVENLFFLTNNKNVYLPSIQDNTVFSFAELRENYRIVLDKINKTGKNISKENITLILNDLPRHNSFRYINNGTLTVGYFKKVYNTLNDPNVYIIVSNTGSPASEVLSSFTNKQYNHASLSFDRDLETIISYNGGEKVYPPGLNKEMLQYFNKKKDASIIVYKLPITKEKKQIMADKIKEININGSAYNLLGLVFKYSHRPNIMFFSQFVYKMLKEVGMNYFEKKDEKIKPTDLIELDYYRKLKFEYEMKFNDQ